MLTCTLTDRARPSDGKRERKTIISLTSAVQAWQGGSWLSASPMPTMRTTLKEHMARFRGEGGKEGRWGNNYPSKGTTYHSVISLVDTVTLGHGHSRPETTCPLLQPCFSHDMCLRPQEDPIEARGLCLLKSKRRHNIPVGNNAKDLA